MADQTRRTMRPSALGRVRTVALAFAAVLAAFGGPGLLTPQPVRALSVLLIVNTTSDAIFPADLGCSLRAAITAANSGAASGYCGSGSADPDDIEFSLSAGSVITVATSLPTITQTIGIDGTIGGGGRVRITGPGSGTGLSVSGAGSIIRDVTVDGFEYGIELGATGSKVFGSVIGPNSSTGIYAPGGGTIGGPTGTTQGGACTGDCNVIAGNPGIGLYLANSGTVQGNHIGINAAGTTAAPNGSGIQISSGTWKIGGTVAGERNVISGNAGLAGLFANGCSCTIQGNRIGTNSAGTAAVPNSSLGMSIQSSGPVVIGGSAAGAGNIISGNGASGIELLGVNAPIIQGNSIGVSATGAPLGNGGEGINLTQQSPGVDNAKIGSATVPAAANHIANNGGNGVTVSDTGTGNQIRGNSIHDNNGVGINIAVGGNEGVVPPVITDFGPVRGTACAGCEVDVFSDSAGEGRIFEGTATVAGDGTWTFDGYVTGTNITATATTPTGSTSAFSNPFGVYSPFTDTADSPFANEIYWLYANGITTGCTADAYCPKGTVSREQMASFLVRMFGLPSTATDFFTDDETSIHETNINRLAAEGITTGCTATTFCPKELVTRAQMASFIVRAAGFTTGGTRNYFSDDAGNIHEGNINRAAAAGVASGCGSYLFCPSGTVTREQMAAFLYRIVHPVNPPPYPAP